MKEKKRRQRDKITTREKDYCLSLYISNPRSRDWCDTDDLFTIAFAWTAKKFGEAINWTELSTAWCLSGLLKYKCWLSKNIAWGTIADPRILPSLEKFALFIYQRSTFNATSSHLIHFADSYTDASTVSYIDALQRTWAYMKYDVVSFILSKIMCGCVFINTSKKISREIAHAVDMVMVEYLLLVLLIDWFTYIYLR